MHLRIATVQNVFSHCYHFNDPLRFAYSLLQYHHFILFRGVQWQLLRYQLFYSLIQFHVVLRDERDGTARPTCTRSSTYSVYVVLAMRRDVKVDDDINMWNVQASAEAKKDYL